jgi:2'-5' RNA ligase
MVRIFFAVEIADPVRHAIGETGRKLRKSPARMTFVDPRLMHITLKFLGDVSAQNLELILSAAENLQGSSYEITAAKVGFFGRPPRVVTAGISDGGKTALLAGQLDDLLEPLGFQRASKSFSPHITIARVKQYAPDLQEIIVGISATSFGTCTIDRVLLKKSTLTPDGPVYETLFTQYLD